MGTTRAHDLGQASAIAALERLETKPLTAPATSDATSLPVDALERPIDDSLPKLNTATLVADERDRVVYFDAGAEQLFMVAPSDALGRPLSDFLREGSRPGTTSGQRADGATFPVSVTRSELRLDDRRRWLVTVQDQGFLLANAKLRQAQIRFSNLIEQIPAVTFMASLEGPSEIYVSPQIETLLGYSQAEWTRSSSFWYERLHPDDKPRIDAALGRSRTSGGPFQAECRFVGQDGRIVWIHGDARVVRDMRGRPLYLQGVAFDVTDIRHLHEEQALRAAAEEENRRERLLSEVSVLLARSFSDDPPLDALSDLLVPSACDYCVIDVLGDRPDEQATIPQSAVLVTDENQELYPTLSPLLARFGGHSLLAAPLRMDGEAGGLLALGLVERSRRFAERDVRFVIQLSERVAISLENARLYQRTQAAVRSREQLVEKLARAIRFSETFLGVLGHDLRNPLSGIVTAATLLERRVAGEALTRPVTRILNSAQRMRRMIEQLLDFTAIRLGHGLPLETRPMDLGELCQMIIDELRGERDPSAIALECEGNTAGAWDSDRLGQLVSNLVGNAIQHREAGTPVTVRLSGEADAVVLGVHNRGPIPADLLPVVFEPMRTSLGSRHAGSSGLGLGLFITREIALAHGGSIEVRSTENDGTLFSVRLPRHA